MKLEFPVRSEAFVTVGDARWYSALQENALYRQDLLSGELHFIGQFPTKAPYRLHGGVICVDNVLYFASMEADGFDIYDIRQGSFLRIPLDKDVDQTRCICRHIFQIGDGLYFVDNMRRYRVYRYSLLRRELDVIETADVEQNGKSRFITMDAQVDEGKLLFADMERKMAVWFDPEMETFHTEAIATKNQKLLTIQRINDDLWFSGDRYISRYHLDTKTAEDLDIFPPGFGNFKLGEHGEAILEQDLDHLSEHSFDESMVCDGKIVFVPRKSNMLVVLDPETKEMLGVDIPPETEETLSLANDRATHSRFIGYEKLPDGGILMFSTQDGAFWTLDGSLMHFRTPQKLKLDFWDMKSQDDFQSVVCYETSNGIWRQADAGTKKAQGFAGQRILEAVTKKMGRNADG